MAAWLSAYGILANGARLISAEPLIDAHLHQQQHEQAQQQQRQQRVSSGHASPRCGESAWCRSFRTL